MTIFVPFLSMKRIYFISNKCLHFLLAIQILNLSFGNLAKEGHVFAHAGTENNQIDSAVEYITENLLGWDNYIPEKHKAHQDNHFIKANTGSWFCEKTTDHSASIEYTPVVAHAIFLPGSLTEHSREINPPPPKAADRKLPIPFA